LNDEENMKLKIARWLLMSLVSCLLFLVAFRVAGVKEGLSAMGKFPAWIVIGILSLFALNLLVVSFRLGRILSHFGMTLPPGVVFRASVAGYVSGMLFISLIGQVFGRHMILRRYGVSSTMNSTLMAYERAVLLFVSGGMALAGCMIWVNDIDVVNILTSYSLFEIALVAVLSFVLSLWLWRSNFESRLIARSLSRKTIMSVLETTMITLLAQFLVLLTFSVEIIVLYPGANILSLLAASAIISFAASMPITINGWGLREVAAVYVLGKIGIPAPDALAISILVGLCSTAVILAAAPLCIKKQNNANLKRESTNVETEFTESRKLDMERGAAWIIGLATAVLVFFQIYMELPSGVINLNLADPFALLALAAVALHMLDVKQLPRWRVPEFNKILFLISLLLVFGFFRGVSEIGITQWVIAGRLMGWLVLLGYLSAGYLAVSIMGAHGMRRISQTMLVTAATIVMVQICMRWINYHGLISFDLPFNFEGYAVNRNAFAFQMLVCSLLTLSYSALFHRAGTLKARIITGKSFFAPGALMPIFLHGAVLVGLALSASRAGLIVGTILLVTAYLVKCVDRRMIFLSAGFAFIILLLFSVEIFSPRDGIQEFSAWKSQSTSEHMETIVRGLELWKESPVLGTGLGIFIEKSATWFGRPIVIHSTPIWILVEFGLLGMFVFIWILFIFMRFIYRTGMRSPASGVIAMLLAVFIVFGLVHEIFYQRIFWLTLGLALAVPSVYFRERKCIV
jgi:uncharacterized membrane protein YbhN (UPF0104 family)